MRALRASAVVLPRASDTHAGGGGASSGLGADLVMPSSSPYLHRTGSAPPIVVASPTYAYASAEVRPACLVGLKTDHPCLASQPMTLHTHSLCSPRSQAFYPGGGYGPPSYSPQALPHHPPQAVAFVQHPPQQQHQPQPLPQPQQESLPPHAPLLQH